MSSYAQLVGNDDGEEGASATAFAIDADGMRDDTTAEAAKVAVAPAKNSTESPLLSGSGLGSSSSSSLSLDLEDSTAVASVVQAPEVDSYGAFGIATADALWTPEQPSLDKVQTLHVPCLLLSAGTVVCAIGFLAQDDDDDDLDKDHGWLVAALVFFALYLVESLAVPFCTHSTLKFLCNMQGAGRFDDEHGLFEEMRAARPSFFMSIECYHNERRTRHVTETYTHDGKTKTRRRRESYTEKVVTHRAKETKKFGSWADLSGPGPRMGDVGHDYVGVVVSVRAVQELDDVETERSFLEQKQAFVNLHRFRDQHFDFKEWVHYPGFRDAVMLHEHGSTPWFVSPWAYVAATACLLSWPYRLFVQSKVMQTMWTLRTKVSVHVDAFQAIPDALPQ